jgi:hypothetical protein
LINAEQNHRYLNQPIAAWQESQIASATRELRGTRFLAHVRCASTGGQTVANANPFLQQGRIFADNGVVQGVAELDARAADLGAASLVSGQTDSERVFALITAETARRGGGVANGLVAAITWMSEKATDLRREPAAEHRHDLCGDWCPGRSIWPASCRGCWPRCTRPGMRVRRVTYILSAWPAASPPGTVLDRRSRWAASIPRTRR